MAYDVFLVSALEDRDIAKLVARRLRALKFKVRFDQKQIDDTFDPKDARDAANSRSVLVLWSEAALKSDWVRAAASVGHSMDDALSHAVLDKTRLSAPFNEGRAFAIDGLTPRALPDGFFELVDALGARQGRTDLRAWMGFRAKDEDEKAAWLAAHPEDPLALAAEKTRKRKLAEKPAPAAAAAGAAALAANSLRGARPAAPGANGTSGQTLNPPRLASGAPMLSMSDEGARSGWSMLAPVLIGIAAMFVLSFMMKSEPAPGANALAIGNAVLAAPCSCEDAGAPAPLEHGPIIVDE